MAGICTARTFSPIRAIAAVVVVAATSLLLGACAQVGGPGQAASLLSEPDSQSPGGTPPDAGATPQKAAEYWSKVHAKNPSDPDASLHYARALKALGDKQRAVDVLKQAVTANPAHRGLNGEYGRLALDMNQIDLAQQLLERGDDPNNPDWRVVSARGTALAKAGKYRESIPFYERALTLSPNQPTVLNNLALAYAMEGDAARAEPLLKRAASAGAGEPRINQNLALVLGLQGKYDEAKLSAARSLPPDSAAADVDFVKRMVRAEPRPLTTAALTEAMGTPGGVEKTPLAPPARTAKAAAPAKAPATPSDAAEKADKPEKAAAAKPAKVAKAPVAPPPPPPVAAAPAAAPQKVAGKTEDPNAQPELRGSADDTGARMLSGWTTQAAASRKSD